MRLQNLLRPELVKIELGTTKRTAAIREVAELLKADPRVKDFDKFYSELLARERIETTCLECGIALPHARTDHVSDMTLAIGRSAEGIFFENSNQTANLLFVVGTPKRMATEYLRIMGTIARLMKGADLRTQLMAATTPEEIVNLLVEAENKL
jgi:mannitol/fructose-specific phosphotransferase system IIA component (Ntr-type)